MDELIKIIRQNAKRPGEWIITSNPVSKKEEAESLRNFWIDFYENHYVDGVSNCFNKQRQDAEYNLRAYEIMTDKQVLMSEKRANKIDREDFERQWKIWIEIEEQQKRMLGGYRNIVWCAA